MNLCDKSVCSSCGMCINVCPKNAIKYVTNKYGFNYPEINKDLCVDCGLCAKKCPAINDIEKKMPQNAFAVWSNNPDDRKSSTSGGAASVFYQKILSQNGICYGATYDENLNVIIEGYSNEQVYDFKNSKYVHSDMKNTYLKILENLKNNKQVIFIGLPCQVAAIKSYLGKEYSNLILVDIICHGTPPQEYLNQHIKHYESKKHEKAEQVKFRSDNEYYFILKSKKRKKFINMHKNIDTYMISFIKSLTYYDSCYACKYACNERVSDITIGDFWGLGTAEPFNHPYSGAISLVLTNTEKGNAFFDSVKDKCFYEKRKVREALDGNAQLNNPSPENKNRKLFLDEYEKSDFETAVLNVYGDYIKAHKNEVKKYEANKKLRLIAKKILRR